MSIPFLSAYELPFGDQRQKQRAVALLLALAFIPLVLIYLKFKSFLAVVGLSVMLGAFATALFSIQRTLILLFVYISFLPSYHWGSRYPFFHGIYFSELIACGFLLVLIIWCLGEEMHGKRNLKISFSSLDATVLAFLILVIIATLKGAFENGNLRIIKSEFFFLLCYGFYFLFTTRLSIRQLATLWKILLLICTGVSIQFIMLTLSEGSLSSIIVNRVVTQQPHLAQLGIPLFASYILFENSLYKKIVATFLMLPIFPMVFLCQQRALWVSIVCTTFALAGFAFFKDSFSLSKLVRFIILVLVLLGLTIGIILVLDKYITGSVILTASSRIQSLAALGLDESTNIRLSEIFRALGKWKSNPLTVLFGTGLGDNFESIDLSRTNTVSVDNSFIFILWKIGLFGLTAYLGVCFLFLKRGLYVFINASQEWQKRLAAALISGMSGLALIAFTNACLVNYRFIVFWALAIATIEVLYIGVRDEKTQSVILAGKP